MYVVYLCTMYHLFSYISVSVNILKPIISRTVTVYVLTGLGYGIGIIWQCHGGNRNAIS